MPMCIRNGAYLTMVTIQLTEKFSCLAAAQRVRRAVARGASGWADGERRGGGGGSGRHRPNGGRTASIEESTQQATKRK